ncbi:MAG: tetratricopeptide repeat protein [Muribaculaceae bacterium]|nr:tetratricopeptide repeat protein [Muribaculaceae bacterium]
MANEKQNETRTSIDELNETLTNVVEQKVQNNKKSILLAIAAVVVVAVAVMFFLNMRQSNALAADEAIAQADMSLIQGNDSIALTQYMQVADNEGYDAGNRAALQAAILLYKKGEYQKALDYLSKYSPEEAIVGAASYSLQGDCYVNLEKYNEAVAAFDKAISASDDNELYTPLFMIKQANVYRELKDFNKEVAVYEKIKKEYPGYAAAYNLNIDKYIERAKASQAK